MSVLLGDRGRFQRLRRPPGEPRRHACGGVAGAAREAARVQTADGGDVSRASSSDNTFNYDFHVTHTKKEWEAGKGEYNFRSMDFRLPASGENDPFITQLTASVGTDWPTYRQEGPGMSAFVLEDGVVYHTYSAYERGVDGLWGMYQWLDRTPKGRNETGLWWRRHDEYDKR